jgi:hypothetical protein
MSSASGQSARDTFDVVLTDVQCDKELNLIQLFEHYMKAQNRAWIEYSYKGEASYRDRSHVEIIGKSLASLKRGIKVHFENTNEYAIDSFVDGTKLIVNVGGVDEDDSGRETYKIYNLSSKQFADMRRFVEARRKKIKARAD